MSRAERFPRRQRICRKRDFEQAFAEGRRRSGRDMLVVIRPNATDESRLGLAVGRKVGNAIVRNRLKRRLREIFRRNRDRLPESVDLVVVLRPSAAELSFDDLRDRFIGLAREEEGRPGRQRRSGDSGRRSRKRPKGDGAAASESTPPASSTPTTETSSQ